jgi:hypothetical protein
MARDHGAFGSLPVAAEETFDAGGHLLSPAQPAMYSTAASIPAHTTGDADSRPPNRPPLRAIWLTPEEPHPAPDGTEFGRGALAGVERALGTQQGSRRRDRDAPDGGRAGIGRRVVGRGITPGAATAVALLPLGQGGARWRARCWVTGALGGLRPGVACALLGILP